LSRYVIGLLKYKNLLRVSRSLISTIFFLGFWSISSLGNPTCKHTGVKRLKVRGNERLQRGINVRGWRGHFLRPERSTGRIFYYHISVYFVLFHRHPFLGVHTQSE